MNQTEKTRKPDSSKVTKGVKTLLGDPKKAIISLSIPMIIAMSSHTIYNLVDALWVSGFGMEFFTTTPIEDIGAEALAAVGFAMPFYMMIIAISTGIGIGGGSAISRRIGAKEKIKADNTAIHSIVITLITAAVFTIILFTLAPTLFPLIGAETTADMAISYGQIIFAGMIFIFFSQVGFAVLRAEGDAKRAMYAMIFGAGLNIILDPIFIYTLRLGLVGAAYATVLSMATTTILLIYWLFIRNDTYLTFTFKDFTFKKHIIKDIFKVGLPASIQQLSMSIMMLIIIIIIGISTGSEAGVAVYNTGWRITMIAVLPLLGMATAVTTVTGATYGAGTYKKLNTAYLYAARTGFIIEVLLAIFIFLLAPYIADLFTTTQDAFIIRNDLVLFLQITCLFYPGAAFGIVSSAMFQGIGKGTNALIATLLRTLILTVFLSILFSIILDFGLPGIWWALVIANLMGSIISFAWGKWSVNKLLTEKIKTT